MGDIVKQESLSIDPHTTALQLTDRLAEMGASLLVGCVSDLHYHLDRCIPQPAEGITLGIHQADDVIRDPITNFSIRLLTST